MYHPHTADQEYLILATFQYNEVFVVSISTYLSQPHPPHPPPQKPQKQKKKKKL